MVSSRFPKPPPSNMSRKTVGPPVGCYSVTTLSFSIMESSSGGADGSKGPCGGWLDTPFSGWGATSEPALSNVSSEELAGSPARRPGSDDRLSAISGGSEGAPSRTRRQVLRAHEYQEALIEYWNVLRVDPAHPQAVRQAGLAHYHLGAVRRDSASGLPALSVSVLDDALRSGSTKVDREGAATSGSPQSGRQSDRPRQATLASD